MIIHDNGEDEESVKDELLQRKREKGKGIEETRDEPLPTPIRSLRTHIAPLSLDKETLKELTVTTEVAPSSLDKEKLQELTVIDSRPSSSSPKLKTSRFRRYKSFIQQMGGHYCTLFEHLKKTFMLKKSFFKLAETLQKTLEEVIPSMTKESIRYGYYDSEALQKERVTTRVSRR
nr:hypothetical protein [Tanacetum cinerariifolium]